MQNVPRIPKITLRTPADQAKDSKNVLQEKCTFFLTIFRQTPSWEDEVREPSVYIMIQVRLPLRVPSIELLKSFFNELTFQFYGNTCVDIVLSKISP